MKNYVIVFVLIISLSLSSYCQNDKNIRSKYVDNSINVNDNNVPLNKKQYYFPVEVFRDKSMYKGYDTTMISKYSKPLHALKEPLLFNHEDTKEAYRFLWLRTSLNPIVIRAERNGEEYKLYWKMTDGILESNPGDIILNQAKVIDKDAWDKLVKLVNKTKYWDMETNEKKVVETGGSRWILEGSDADRYHVVDRWTPTKGDYYNCCKYLIKLTELKINSSNIF